MHLRHTKPVVDNIESTSDGDIVIPDCSRDCTVMNNMFNTNEQGSTLAVQPLRHDSHRKQHSRTLSDIFTKLTAVVTDPFEQEEDYDAASVDPLQAVSIQDSGLQSPIVQGNVPHVSGKKHRRVFSSDRVHLSMAHRRMDSIGHSFSTHRNFDGNSRTSPLLSGQDQRHSPPPSQVHDASDVASHRRIDSAGLDLLTVAAHAFHEEEKFDSELVLPRVSRLPFAMQEIRSRSAHHGSWDPDRIREFPMHRVYRDDSHTSHARSQRPHLAQPIFRDRADRSLETASYPYKISETAVYPVQHSKLDTESVHDDYYHEPTHNNNHPTYSTWENHSRMAPPAPTRKKSSAQSSTTNISSSSNPTRSNRHIPSTAFSSPTFNTLRSQSHHHVSWAQKEPATNIPTNQRHMYRRDPSWYGSHPRSTFHHEKDMQVNAGMAWKNVPHHQPNDSRPNASNFPFSSRRDPFVENIIKSNRHKRLTTADMILNDLNTDSALELEPSLRDQAPGTLINHLKNTSGPAPPSLNRNLSDDDANPTKRVINGSTSKRVRRKCEVEGCTNRTVQGGRCIGHGAKRRICGHPGCTKHVKKAGMCSTHGPARKRCSVDGCGKVAVQGGRCVSHGAKKKTCSVCDCPKQATLFGMCKRHHDASKGQASPTTSEEMHESIVTPPFHSDLCLPIHSSSAKHEKTHQRGLSIFHDMSTVDTILASAYATSGYSGPLKGENVDVNAEASGLTLTEDALDNSLGVNAVSV